MAFLGNIREKREKHREEKRLLLLNDIDNPGTVKLVKKYGDPVSVSDMLYQSDNGTVIRQTNSYAEFLLTNGIALAPGKAGTRQC